jgi:hypothetical protein
MTATCDTEHTEAVIASGRCGDCGQLWCSSCERAIEPSDLRYETNSPGEPSFVEWGCVHCLKGRHVHMTAEREAMLKNERDERQISERQERRVYGFRGDWAW